MRDHYEEKLDGIYNQLTRLGDRCSLSVSMAIEALMDLDLEKASEVILAENEIDNMSERLERACVLIVLKEQPVANDLRFVTSAVHMISDLERVGDIAFDICELVLEMPKRKMDKKALLIIEDMANATNKMISDAIQSYAQGDEDLAMKTGNSDDIIDQYFKDVCETILNKMHDKSLDPTNGVDMIIISKYLERIGDHAQNISEQVLFSLTGKAVKFN